MRDIIAYEEDVAKRLAIVFVKLGVPALGPEIGKRLLDVVGRLNQVIKENPILTREEKQVLMDHRDRILDICAVEAYQGKEIIDTFERMLKQ